MSKSPHPRSQTARLDPAVQFVGLEELGAAVLRGEYALDEVTDREVQARIAEAEAQLTEEQVNLRWDRRALSVIRRAAAQAGVPYQTYVKQVAFRQALTDLRD